MSLCLMCVCTPLCLDYIRLCCLLYVIQMSTPHNYTALLNFQKHQGFFLPQQEAASVTRVFSLIPNSCLLEHV